MKIDSLFSHHSLDGVVLTSVQYRRYFSGFTGSAGLLLLLPDGAQHLYVDGRYTEQAKQQAADAAVTEYKDSLYEGLANFTLERLGFEDETMTYAQYQKLQKAVPNATLVPLSKQLSPLRMVKSQAELACIEQAASIADRAFDHIITFLKAGMTELEVAEELESFMRKNGAEGLSFDTIVAAGDHSALPHATPSQRVIARGDFVLMDYGCLYNGYCSDMTRTVAVGAISEEQQKIYRTVLQAQQACLALLAPHVTGVDADKAAREVIEGAGYQLPHSTGHGVGLKVHEDPRLSPTSKHILQAGMVVTVEPGIYVPGLGGVRIEDLVVVTEEGCRNFTHAPKELMILP